MKRLWAILGLGIGLQLFFFPLVVEAIMTISIDHELHLLEQGQTPSRHIPWAKYRVAVCTYEDPEATGLGNDIAAIIAREVLLNSGVSSIGVLTYEGDLSPKDATVPSYFDKVEKLTENQGVVLSIWGRVLPVQDSLRIDTVVQLSPETLQQHFVWELHLPQAMGGGVLQAHLRPDRMHLQTLYVKKSAKTEIISAAQSLKILRQEPTNDAPIVTTLSQDKVYSILTIQNDWAQYSLEDGTNGWVPVSGYCKDSCKPLLEPAKFAGGLLRYMENRKIRNATEHLTTEALAIEEQIKALDALDSTTSEEIRTGSLDRAMRWTGSNRWTGKDKGTNIDRGQGVPPGGAAFANVKALAEIAIKLYKAFELEYESQSIESIFNRICLRQEEIRPIIDELAKASLEDPNNVDVLNNLAVLFRFLGDSQREELANSIVKEILLKK